MSIAYGRLAAIRDYWMPRDQDARAEVRVSDLDAVLTEMVRLSSCCAELQAATVAMDDPAINNTTTLEDAIRALKAERDALVRECFEGPLRERLGGQE